MCQYLKYSSLLDMRKYPVMLNHFIPQKFGEISKVAFSGTSERYKFNLILVIDPYYKLGLDHFHLKW